MRHTEPVVEDGEVVEDVCHLRLFALLHELVREKGNRARLRRWVWTPGPLPRA